MTVYTAYDKSANNMDDEDYKEIFRAKYSSMISKLYYPVTWIIFVPFLILIIIYNPFSDNTPNALQLMFGLGFIFYCMWLVAANIIFFTSSKYGINYNLKRSWNKFQVDRGRNLYNRKHKVDKG